VQLRGRFALLGIAQNDAPSMIIDQSPLFDLFQGSKAAQAGQVVIQAAIADAWGLSGTVNITHGLCPTARLRIESRSLRPIRACITGV
jgi:hypothetical protein